MSLEPRYIPSFYEIARDLAPSILIIEDLGVFAYDGTDLGKDRNPVLSSLLGEMDGIKPVEAVVTVATTNCLELLDKALSQRPSRFDRVIHFGLPDQAERELIIDHLCQRIRLGGPAKGYIVEQTNGLTPAQVQEVVFGIAIEHGGRIENLAIPEDLIDRVISQIKAERPKSVGFNHC